jgi:hypothetical protein
LQSVEFGSPEVHLANEDHTNIENCHFIDFLAFFFILSSTSGGKITCHFACVSRNGGVTRIGVYMFAIGVAVVCKLLIHSYER